MNLVFVDQAKNINIAAALYKYTNNSIDIKIAVNEINNILFLIINNIILSILFVLLTKESSSLVLVRYPLSLPMDKNLFFL